MPNGGAILLAAGFGRRFGSDKRRYRLKDGTPMLLATARAYLGTFDRLVVVLRETDDDLARLLESETSGLADIQALSSGKSDLSNESDSSHESDLSDESDLSVVPPVGLQCAVCTDAHLGMGHSLATGARAAADWDYLFVGLADMPFIRSSTLAELRDAMASEITRGNRRAIVKPRYAPGTADGLSKAAASGHPMGFGSAHIPTLIKLTGDIGARQLVKASHADIIEIPVSDEGVLTDVDKPRKLGSE